MNPRIIIFLLFFCLRMNVPVAQAQKVYALPPEVRAELFRLDAAYSILDHYSREVWPGWDNYLQFPFMMSWQNGLRIMIGYPVPPPGFFRCGDLRVHGLEVWADTSSLNSFRVVLPQCAGGGVLPYGNVKDKPMTIVSMVFRNVSAADTAGSPSVRPEDHILVFIHELMHCYQGTMMKQTYGNLQLNPDLNFALYSELEGLALQKAYLSLSGEESKQYLRDFITARSHKYSGLGERELRSARCDEFREGEAEYSEMVILDCLEKGYRPATDPSTDPEYKAFDNPSLIREKYWKKLVKNTGDALDIYPKNYEYGCFLALLLKRYDTDWQKEIEEGSWLDLVLRKDLGYSASDSLQSEERFKSLYPIAEAQKRISDLIEARNSCYRMFCSLRGKTYIIDCKELEEGLASHALPSKPVYSLGLISMFPSGTGTFTFDSVNFSPAGDTPSEVSEIYYLKMINTRDSGRGRGYRIEYRSREKDDVYTGATVITPLFTLKAPKIQVVESKGRVKFRILART